MLRQATGEHGLVQRSLLRVVDEHSLEQVLIHFLQSQSLVLVERPLDLHSLSQFYQVFATV